MNTEKFFVRALVALFVITLTAGMAFGQNLVVGADATFTGSGTYKVKGNIDNTSRTAEVTINGAVELNGTSGQAIGVATKPAVNFETLKATAASTKTVNVNVTVASAIDVTSAGATKFDLGDRKLTLQGTIANTGGAATPYDFTNTSSEVDYAKTSGNQTTFGTTYGKLTFSGASTHDLGGATVAGGVVSHAGGALTVNNNLTANAGYAFATIANVSGGSTLDLAGSADGSIATVTTVSSGSSIRNSGGAELTIATLSGNAGTVEATGGTGKVAFTNAATNSTGGVIQATASGGEIRFNNNLANGGTINLSAGAKGFITGSFTAVGSLNLAASSDWTYNGTDQDVAGAGAGVTYGNLLFTNGGTKTALGNVSLQATSAFDNGGASNDVVTLNMGTYALSIPSGTKDNTNSTIQFAGASNGQIFTTGTIDYNGGAITQTVAGHATDKYATLLFTNAGTKQIAAATRVATSGNLTVNSGITAHVSDATSSLVVDGDLTNNGTVNNAGTVTVGGE